MADYIQLTPLAWNVHRPLCSSHKPTKNYIDIKVWLSTFEGFKVYKNVTFYSQIHINFALFSHLRDFFFTFLALNGRTQKVLNFMVSWFRFFLTFCSFFFFAFFSVSRLVYVWINRQLWFGTSNPFWSNNDNDLTHGFSVVVWSSLDLFHIRLHITIHHVYFVFMRRQIWSHTIFAN